MKKLLISAACMGAFLFTACSESGTTATETTTTATTETTQTTNTTETTSATADTEAMYRDRASRISSQMATDMNLDTATQARVTEIYYNRSSRYGGLAEQYTTDTTGQASAYRSIDMDVDRELKTVLSPQQYKTYEGNRSKYAELKIKGEDGKLKMEGDEAKLKTGDSKVKIDGEESKMKSGDTKVKSEPGESKYKSGDTKVKSETK